MKPKNDFFWNIDVLRFFLCLVIVFFHLFHGSGLLPGKPTSGLFADLFNGTTKAHMAVQCFFLLSGFFLFHSLERKKNESFGAFVGSKIIRLWPVFAVATVVNSLFINVTWQRTVMDLAFLQCNGISFDYKGINWYVSSLFWTLLFYHGLHHSITSRQSRNLVVAIIVYFSYMINLYATKGGFGRETVYGVFSLGLLQGLAGVGLGYLLAQIKRGATAVSNKRRKMATTAFATLVEVAAFALIVYLLLFGGGAKYKNQFVIVVVFSCLMLAMASRQGLCSALLNRKIFGFGGRYTYSIYVMQQTAFCIMKRTIWGNENLMSCPVLSIIVSMLFAVALGIVAYYVVEKPTARLVGLLFNSSSGTTVNNYTNK